MTKKHLFSIVIALTIFSSWCSSQELVEWRGFERTGIYNETGLLKEWPAEGPKLLWSYDGLEKGFSSVTVVGDKVYCTGQKDGIGFLVALDTAGKLIWKAEYGKEWNESFPGSRTTPVYFKGMFYLSSALCEAMCIDAKTGKKIWSVDLKEKFNAQNITWGVVEAPIVVDNKVIFTPGGENISILALNRMTGETIWTSKATSEKSAYCSPLLFTHNNKQYIATSLINNIVGIDINDGKLLWNISQVNQHSIHPNTPMYKNGYIYSMTGYKTGGVMIKLSDDGQSAIEVWRNTSLDGQMGGAVWIDNYIVGSGHQSDKSWQCLDAKTGEVLHTTKEIGKGVVIYADGLYYCYADNGEMGIMELNENGFKLKSKFRVQLGTDQHWAHPVIDKGILYIRHGNTLMAYSIKV